MSTPIVTVVGVTFEGRQEHLILFLRWANGGKGRQLAGELRPEPTNRRDPNAIAVWIGPEDTDYRKHVGYVPAPLAKKWTARMQAGQRFEVTEVGLKVGKENTVGVRIRVEIQGEDDG